MICISRSSDFVIFWRLFDVCTSYFGSMNQYDPTFDLKINVGHCDLHSMVQWFLHYILKTTVFDLWTILFGIMSQYDTKFDLKINIGHYDLYFMVQWFCLASWRLFDVYTSYFGSMNQYHQTFDLKINVGHCDLYAMIQWFSLYLEDYLMHEHYYLGLWVSMTQSCTSK